MYIYIYICIYILYLFIYLVNQWSRHLLENLSVELLSLRTVFRTPGRCSLVPSVRDTLRVFLESAKAFLSSEKGVKG